MTRDKNLCLNMIVKNEMANIARCLASVAPYISCWVIGDTGSTDGTQAFIESFFGERRIPGELHRFPFVNFEQARNAALECAERSALAYDYLLLADADMELVVEDPAFRARLEAPSYTLLQRASLSYWNARLLRRDAGGRYRGVTHEYLDVPGGGEQLHGIWYKDHASGSNRPNKFERDIKLLSDALEQEPGNLRYWFYLAQSYRDAGRPEEAARAYAKRAEMGGWDEEAWYARLQQSRCLRTLGDEGGFVRQALAAFNQRPQRAEPLYDLARFHREKSMNDASALFVEAGFAVPRPPHDVLFLEDFVYTAGFQEEYSIVANYARDPVRKDRGFAACNWLALNRDVPAGSRALARSNLFFYLQPARATMPSFAARRIAFTAPEGYRAMNPSVALVGDDIMVSVRTVNYVLTETGQYQMPEGAPIQTRNFLLRLGDDLGTRSAAEILAPADMPEPRYREVIGFEDIRLFAWRDGLWVCACVRQLTDEGWCEQVLARIDADASGGHRLVDWRALHPAGPRLHEKNWMPRVDGDKLGFIYLCDPTRVLDENAREVSMIQPVIAAETFSGGSQAIAFDGGWLALIHEAKDRPAPARRCYQHRFAWFDRTDTLRRVSRPFFFHDRDIEFAAGLAWHPDRKRLLVSYGTADSEAWIATIDAGEVRVVLDDVENLPSGAPRSTRPETGGAASPQPSTPAIQPEPMKAPAATAAVTPNAACSGRKDGVAADALRDHDVAPGANDRGAGARPIAAKSPEQVFLELAPFLRAVDSPRERRLNSSELDARNAPLLGRGNGLLPQIHAFYEAMSDAAEHPSLAAAIASMRAAGHPVRLWTYSPQRLEGLRTHGVELCDANEVVPLGTFQRVLAGAGVRYFSDLFRYAVLYEHGGLWMDSDVILLRPFPFRGDHFLNLQWRGAHKGHYICGNVMYAEPYSRHMRSLYEQAIDRFHDGRGKEFGDIGPKLLSDYVASEAGAELRERLSSPMLFNTIDWTELDRFDQPISALADYLNDERVFGIHLWTARNEARPSGNEAPLGMLLSDPLGSFPSLTSLADRFNTDKNRVSGNRHGYARIYDRLLAPRRFSLRRLLELGLCRGLAERNQTETPSVTLWQSYFPFCQVIGVDLTDFSRFNNERFTSFVCDQSKRDELRAVAEKLGPGSLDMIIDDGSHASFDQQLTLKEFFPLLAEGGWYFIEDLDWQPPGEDASSITLTKDLLREMQRPGGARSLDPLGVGELAGQIAEILFFDSHYELQRANLLGGLVAIRKRGGAGFIR